MEAMQTKLELFGNKEKQLTYFCDRKRHLICKPYSIANLHKMAEQLGIKRCWFHSKSKKGLSHYDIPKTRIKEIMNKCNVVSSREIIKIAKN